MVESNMINIHKKINKPLMDYASRFTVAIYGTQDHKPVQCGTGTLFEIGDYSIIITAKHVLDLNLEHGIQLCVSDSDTGGSLKEIHGTTVVEAKYDIGYVILSSEMRDILKQNRDFANQGMVDKFNSRPDKLVYYLFGYPSIDSHIDTANRTVNSTAISYSTGPYEGDTDLLDNYDKDAHLLLNANNNDNIDVATGAALRLPELPGISGSSVWSAYIPGRPLDTWNVNDAKICGIETSIYKNGAIIRATKWAVLTELLYKSHPDLHTILRIAIPTDRVRG